MIRRDLIKVVLGGAAFFSPPTTIGAETSKSTYLAGNAHDLVPQGKGEGVEIVAIGGHYRESMQVLIRNNSGRTVRMMDITGVARNASNGDLSAVVQASTIVPALVEDSGIAIGNVDFGFGNGISPLADFEFEVEYVDPEDGGRQNLEIVEIKTRSEDIIGIAENTSENTTEGTITIFGLIFNEEGEIQGYVRDTAIMSDLAPGDGAPFEAEFHGDAGMVVTDLYLIGAYSWAK